MAKENLNKVEKFIKANLPEDWNYVELFEANYIAQLKKQIQTFLDKKQNPMIIGKKEREINPEFLKGFILQDIHYNHVVSINDETITHHHTALIIFSSEEEM